MTVDMGGLPVEPRPAQVTVIDVDMPFWSMVQFMFKWALATIPAALMLVLLGAMIWLVLAGLGVGRLF